MKIIALILFQIISCYNQTLGINLVINSNLTQPLVYPSMYEDFRKEITGWKTKNKYVQLVVFKLEKEYFPLFCPFPQSSLKSFTYSDQFLNTDSTSQNEYYYQNFNLTSNRTFLISLDYASQLSKNPDSCAFRIIWNGKTVEQIAESTCEIIHKQYQVVSLQGNNQLAFEGLGKDDSFGILVRNIQLRQIRSNHSQTIVNNTNSQQNKTINSSQLSNSTTNPVQYANQTTNSSYHSNITTNSSVNSNATLNQSSLANSTMNSSQYSNSTTNSSQHFNTTKNSSQQSNNSAQQNYTKKSYQQANRNFLQPFSSAYQLLNQLNMSSSQEKLLKNTLIALNFAATSPLTSFYQFSGLKKYMKNYLGYLIQFNRLLLFNFHDRNFTVTASIIVSFLQYMDDLKGIQSDSYIYPFIGISAENMYSQFQRSNNFVNTNAPFYFYNEAFNQRQFCFLISIADFIFWQLPLAFVMFFIGKILFHVLFKYKISLLFRSFTLAGLLYLSLMEGKIEVYTFQFISEMLFLNFDGFSKKLMLGGMVYFYFIFFILSCTSMCVFLFLYGKKAKYLFDNCKPLLLSAYYYLFNSGFLSISLGLAHRLLRYYPNTQLTVIILLESISAMLQILFLSSRFSENHTSSSLLLILTLLRLCFYLTMIIPQDYQNILCDSLNYTQYVIFQLVLVILIFSALSFITQMFKTVISLLCSSKIKKKKKEVKFLKQNFIKIKLKQFMITIKQAQRSNYPQQKNETKRCLNVKRQIKYQNLKIAKSNNILKQRAIDLSIL